MPALHSAPSSTAYAAITPTDHVLALYAQYAATAHSLACRLLYDRSEAEDVVHDVFLGLWQRSGGFDPERGTARAWLLAIVRNRSLDHLRRRAGRRQDDISELADRLPDVHAPDVVDQVDTAARSERLWRMVDALPACQADVIRRAFVHGQTHQEIADATGLPLGTVKGRIRLGLEKLRCAVHAGAPYFTESSFA
jgi:RNA polymerase sigma-70 factor, ECF subfamily